MTLPTPPPVSDLTYGQYQGWNCCWCNARLTGGAVPAGIAQGASGAHDLSMQVYACRICVSQSPRSRS
ncbi:hypothetical protein CHR28_10170 [Streptomyces sp. XY006]|nr:hypothetical protein CHR28_10170 [Streptomyces sp. XY006]